MAQRNIKDRCIKQRSSECQKRPKPSKRRQNGLGLSLSGHIGEKTIKSELLKDKKFALQGVLTSIANGRTTVPLYAYAFRLLGFGPSLTSGSLSKKSFLTD